MIRPYSEKDKAAAVALFEANVPEFFVAHEIEDIKKYLDDEREDYFVLELNGEILACGGINYEPAHAVISWDAVHPEHRKTGLGGKLLKHRLEHLSNQAKYQKVIVRTSQLSYGFYQKYGFKLEQVVEDYWSPGYHLYYMTLDLTS